MTASAAFFCEDCGEIIRLSQGAVHVRWLRDREHVAREVSEHASSGLDTWMVEGLAFLAEHRGHSISVITE